MFRRSSAPSLFRILNKRRGGEHFFAFRLDLPSKYAGLASGLARFGRSHCDLVCAFGIDFSQKKASGLAPVWPGLACLTACSRRSECAFSQVSRGTAAPPKRRRRRMRKAGARKGKGRPELCKSTTRRPAHQLSTNSRVRRNAS